MARRKRVLDDSDSDSSEASGAAGDFDLNDDPDAREERALFENPYQNKRRRKNGKEDALYGVFAEDSEDEEPRGRERGGKTAGKRSDWAKAPAFVSGEKVGSAPKDLEMEVDKEANVDVDDDDADSEVDEDVEDEEDEEEDADEGQEYPDDSKPPSPRIREEEEEASTAATGTGVGLGSHNPFASGGMGSRTASSVETAFGFSKGGIGSSKGGIGSSKGGIGSSSGAPASGGLGFSKGGIGSARASTLASTFAAPSQNNAGSSTATPPPSTSAATPTSTLPVNTEDLPSTFGSRSFLRGRGAAAPKPAAQLSAAELLHFSKLQGSFGARMLSKMGWQAGTGLGAAGEGIVTPVESKMRPQKAGIAFRGFKEKTEQSKMEAKRRGEIVSDDEGEAKGRGKNKKGKEEKEKRSDAWKKPKKVKIKVQHKTYEEIVAEAGQDAPPPGIGVIIDATGATPREVSSLADVSLNSWSPSNDLTRIPEVRHNLRLIGDACKADLDGLAREAKALEQRKQWIVNEDLRLRKKVAEEAELIDRLQQLQLVAAEVDTKAKELSSVYEVSLEPFSALFYKLVDQFSKEFERYRLDEIVVAAISPSFRRMVAQWNPLEEPTAFVSTFRNWKRALRVTSEEEQQPKVEVDVYGAKTILAKPLAVEKPMTPFESLLWNVWLPKVRSCINNDWMPQTPQPAVKLYEAWSAFLPPFIRDNLLDQLILPKVHKAVADWNPRKDAVPLQTIVFPWLPHVGLRLEDLVGDARRKVKSLLRSWVIGEDIPADLTAWKEVFDAAEWDAMLLKYVVPKLGATLRSDFRINPRDQKMEPLQQVLAWSKILRPSIFSQILETEFFPKWLEILHIWLIQPRVSFEEVAQWYSFWKSSFPEHVQAMPGVSRGFTQGLQLMNKAIELGADAPTRLPRPEYHPVPSTPTRSTAPKAVSQPAAARTHEITFRSIVEDFATAHNLLLIPTGRAHERSRVPLLRVSSTVDGKKGLMIYVSDDAVWAPVGKNLGGESEEFRAITLDDMVLRANGS